MDETAEELDQQRAPLACSSLHTGPPADPPLGRMSARQTEQNSQDSPSHLSEELFCTAQISSCPPAPLAGALVTSRPQSDVVKRGYLGKLQRSRRRYFVLRTGSHIGPSRLEWYKNKEKFAAVEKSAGKAELFGSCKQGVIYLRCCLGVSRICSSRKGPTVALYANDQTLMLAVEDQWEQEEWYQAIKKLMEEERKDEERGEALDDEDDGYCTLPPAAFFKEVWPITVKPRGLGCSKSLSGESRLCLTATSLILVRVAAGSDLPSVTIPLLSVRRFGHLDGLFFLELGRSAPNGPGEIWVEAKDQESPAVAQHIHEVVRDTVRALRALPDFSRSPTSNHHQLQTLLASKRCRPKHKDKLVNVRQLGSHLAQRNPEIQTSSMQETLKPDDTEPDATKSSASHLSTFRSPQSSESETGNYVEMKMDHMVPAAATVTEDHCRDNACGMLSWEPGEEEEEGLGYVMMSPQGSRGSPILPQDDYVTMVSPRQQNRPASPSCCPQTSFSSSASVCSSCVHPTRPQSSHRLRLLTSVQQSETEAGQSRTGIGGGSTRPQGGHVPAQTRSTSSPARSLDGAGRRTPFVTSGSGFFRPAWAPPNSGTGRPRDASEPSVGRCRRLSLCLPSCLQADDRS